MSHLIAGIIAHVDAGKTTLSEALLYRSGAIRRPGRVDRGDAFLDTDAIERRRGITIFAKEAILNERIALIDTPGHADFSAEMERTLSVLDAAILLISAPDRIGSHTRTLWSLLSRQSIPALIFVNKMDMCDRDKPSILGEIRQKLTPRAVDFTSIGEEETEEIAANDDELLSRYLAGESISESDIRETVEKGNTVPVLFGSALRMEGIDRLLEVLSSCFSPMPPDKEFGAFVYRVSYDRQGARLTHLRITGGTLHSKDMLGSEKANEIRIYSGSRYSSVQEAEAGEACTVLGLKESRAGMAYGACRRRAHSSFTPALVYSVIPPKGMDDSKLLRIMRMIEDEIPEISVQYQREEKEVQVLLMGEVQTEVISEIAATRHGASIAFGEGRIAYKETIRERTIGIGHFEPLRHYAEVHLLIEPGERGSGMEFISELPVNELDTSWQRLILTHLREKTHIGVLTGSPITDIRIRVLAGRAHLKHTEGGDFREATYRAVRQGLMKAESVLLEPYYRFEIIVPDACIGRVLSDIERMHGKGSIESSSDGFASIAGTCPVSTMRNYMNEIRLFSRGEGSMNAYVEGYTECHDSERVIEESGYDAERDIDNPSSSIFCSHGAGFAVPWDEVDAMSHIKC
ncbi:MAG: translation factor GTPase family protein [Candidatus Ornithospirochaeta sp.]|nr:translation factor GTPase family protein [Candidatus Ornithospirochaeta sp.]